jgi:hypothetical protein
MSLGKELESSGFVRFNASDFQDNCGEVGDLCIVRVCHLFKASHIPFGDVRLLKKPEDVVPVLNSLALALRFGLARLHTWILWPLPENCSFGRSCLQILQ